MNRRLLLLISLFTLTACSHVSPPQTATPAAPTQKAQIQLSQLKNWQINGKLAAKTSQNAGSATFTWSQRNHRYLISLLGPLGTHGLKLEGQPGLVKLETAEGQHFTANSPEQLLAKNWGFNLPVSNLTYWIRGLPAPGGVTQSHHDDQGRLTSLVQNGWNVQYLNYTTAQGLALPKRITLTSSSMVAKIIIYQWQI